MPIKTSQDRTLDLPIFHKSYDFIIILSEQIAKFPKKDRYTLGTRLENTALDFFTLIIRANHEYGLGRVKFLAEASITLDLLKILVRLAKDKRAFYPKQYLLLEERLQEIGRMLGGWIKSLRKTEAPP